MSRKDNRYAGVLLEEMNDRFKKIIEMLSLMTGVPEKVEKLSDDMEEVKSDLKIIKLVGKEHSIQLHDHEKRLTKLETT